MPCKLKRVTSWQLHLGLLRVLVAPDPVEGAPDLDAKASAHYVAEHKVAEHKLLTAVIPTASMLNEHCWPEVYQPHIDLTRPTDGTPFGRSLPRSISSISTGVAVGAGGAVRTR